jgi:hypothetical protein
MNWWAIYGRRSLTLSNGALPLQRQLRGFVEMVAHTRNKLDDCDETSIRPGGTFNASGTLKNWI